MLLVFQLLNGQSTAKKDTLTYELNAILISSARYPAKNIQMPYAVSVLTPKEIPAVKGYGLDEVLNAVPGVLAQSRAGGQDIRLTIRGFGARGAGEKSNAGTSRGIRVMVDGIPETEPDGRTSFDQIDLWGAGNIEIVRSNASALWGNASGGIVNISSVPDFDKSFIKLQGMSGSYGFKKAGISFGSTVGTGIIFGSINDLDYTGWREHSSSKRTVVNLGTLTQLAANTKLGVYLAGSSSLFHIPGPLSQAQFDADPTQAYSLFVSRDERRYNRLGRIGTTLNHAINENNEISAMAFLGAKYLQRSERNTFRDFNRYHTGGNFTYSNTLHFSGGMQNKFLVGADEAYQDGAILFYKLTAASTRGTLKDNKREGANTFGSFIQDEFKLNENLSVIAGARYDKVTYYCQSFLTAATSVEDKSFEKVTPKLGVTYRLSPTHSVYANLGGGVEAPAGNETDPPGQYANYLINPMLKPIVSTTIEAGTKQIIVFDNNSMFESVSYNVALYHISVTDDIIPYSNGGFYVTAGKTSRTGIEAGASVNLFNGLACKAAITYSSNKYDEYLFHLISNDSLKDDIAADYKDNKMSGVPDIFYNATVIYTCEQLNSAYVSVNLSGLGKYFVDDANTLEVPAYMIVSASVGIAKPLRIGNLFSVGANLSVNNLLDKKYAASAYINPDKASTPYFLEPGLPRNMTFSLQVQF